MNDPGTSTDTVALVLSVVSLVLAGAAFGWQLLTWFLTGGRCKAELWHGTLRPRGLVSRPVDRSGQVRSTGLRDRLPSDVEVLEVRVTNRGRLPVVVNDYSVKIKSGGLSFQPIADAAGTEPLPHVLQPGHRASWWVTMDHVDALVYAGQVTNPGKSSVVMQVTLATGKVVTTRRAVRRPQAMKAAPTAQA